MPFKPGQSGNPGGRPKGWAEVNALARQHTAAAIEALVKSLGDRRTRAAGGAGVAGSRLGQAYAGGGISYS
jgi:hypothetical protein